MASRSYEKGRRGENEIVNICKSHGIPCKRTPMSKKPDVWLNGRPVEVKVRKKLPVWLKEWAEDHDYMLMREDRGVWLKVSVWKP